MSDQGYTHLRTYRYERKFRVEDLQPFQVAALIKYHPCLFYAPYPARYVNNLYLDTPGMANYYDNIEGAMQRRKVRIRWYGEPFGFISQPRLEVKIKEGMVGTKQSYSLPPFHLDHHFCDRALRQLVSTSDLPAKIRLDFQGLNLVLFNRYYRHYYATHDGAFRLTMDSQLAFYRANSTFGNQFIHRQVGYRDVVVELKYEVEQESHASRVAGFFPFGMTRMSKYVQGIERVYF